jgi:hypothetical protein
MLSFMICSFLSKDNDDLFAAESRPPHKYCGEGWRLYIAL